MHLVNLCCCLLLPTLTFLHLQAEVLKSLLQKLTNKEPCSLLYIKCLMISYAWKSLSEGGKTLITLLKEPVCFNK